MEKGTCIPVLFRLTFHDPWTCTVLLDPWRYNHYVSFARPLCLYNNLARPLGLHYNHYVGPSVCGLIVELRNMGRAHYFQLINACLSHTIFISWQNYSQ